MPRRASTSASRPGAVKTRLHKARAPCAAASTRSRSDTMLDSHPMHVTDVRRAAGSARHVLLLESDDGRELQIWVGDAGGDRDRGLLEQSSSRVPAAYDLDRRAARRRRRRPCARCGSPGSPARTFYAEVVLAEGAATSTRARATPSRSPWPTGAPLLADADVLARARIEAPRTRARSTSSERVDRRTAACWPQRPASGAPAMPRSCAGASRPSRTSLPRTWPGLEALVRLGGPLEREGLLDVGAQGARRRGRAA